MPGERLVEQVGGIALLGRRDVGTPFHGDPAAGRVPKQLLCDAGVRARVHEQAHRSVPPVVKPHPRQLCTDEQGLEMLGEPGTVHLKPRASIRSKRASASILRPRPPSVNTSLSRSVPAEGGFELTLDAGERDPIRRWGRVAST
jgi:hypothetical protein